MADKKSAKTSRNTISWRYSENNFHIEAPKSFLINTPVSLLKDVVMYKMLKLAVDIKNITAATVINKYK